MSEVPGLSTSGDHHSYASESKYVNEVLVTTMLDEGAGAKTYSLFGSLTGTPSCKS